MKKIQKYDVPSVNTRTLAYHDIDQLSGVIKGASFEIQQLGNGNFHTDLFSSSLKKGILDKGFYNRSTLTKGTFSEEYMTFGFIHDTTQEGHINGETMQKHDVLLANENAPLDYALAANATWSSFQFKRDDLFKTNITLPKTENAIYVLDKKTKSRLARELSTIFAQLKEIDNNPGTSLNSDMLYNYVLSLYAHAVDQSTSLTYLKRNKSFFLARMICEYLHEHATEPIQMIDLTHLTGKSERTIERIFKKHFGIAPYSYLKIHRLHLVRNILMKQERIDSINITQIAIYNGFMHMGYFGSEYKKLFNETPSETWKKHI